MLIIGLTGGIGAGKSTVANLFAERGVPIIDADVIARELVLPKQPALMKIVNHFGPSILSSDGMLNRAQLRQIIFTDMKEREWLEKLLHPLIKKAIQAQIKRLTAPYCIAVIPLLFEVKPYPFINRILVVDATREIQRQRVDARDHSHELEAIINAQLSREQKLARADDVITNNGTIADLIPQIDKLHSVYQHLCP